jgi:hypothetical protein
MRFLAFFLAALAGCATTPKEDGSLQVTIAAERVAQCKEQGGCALLTQAEAIAIAVQAYQEGAAEALADLDSHGCRRGGT